MFPGSYLSSFKKIGPVSDEFVEAKKPKIIILIIFWYVPEPSL